jgi:RHS repeat-associated protein
VLEERLNGVSTATVQQVWSPVYVDALVLRDRSTQNNGTLDERLWVQQDANFNVTALLNTSGAAVERYVYDPYGKPTVLTAAWGTLTGSAFAWAYLHRGGRYDTASGLYNFRNRDYSPSLGRWLQLDPIRFDAGDTSLYRMEKDDPMIRVDPTGLQQWVVPPSCQGMAHAEEYAASRQMIAMGELLYKMKKCNEKCKSKQALLQLGRTPVCGPLKIPPSLVPPPPKGPASNDMADFELLMKTAKDEPIPWCISGGCYTWCEGVRNNYPKAGGKLRHCAFNVDFAQWEYPMIGIPWTSHKLGHMAIRITFCDGSKFYLDDGWWRGVFRESDIPFYVRPYDPKCE